MTTSSRQFAERQFRAAFRMNMALGLGALLTISCQFLHLLGLVSPLPDGLFQFALIALPFAVFFYAFGKLIRWIVLGFISDKESNLEENSK